MRKPRHIPPKGVHPPQFGAGSAMSKQSVSHEEVAKRMTFMESLLCLGMPATRAIAQAMLPPPKGLGIGKTSAQNYINRVRERWVIEAEATRHTNKAEAVARITAHLFEARADRKWQAVAAFERLISDIQGTREPVRIDVSMNVNAALMHVIGNLTDNQRESILAEYEELEEKAKLAESLSLVAPSKLNGSSPH